MGYLDRLDILKWIDYIIQKDPIAKIVLHGISMGGATVMMTTGEKLPSNVKAAVEDCGYSLVYDQFASVLKNDMQLPEFPIMNAATMMTKIRGKYDLRVVSTIDLLKKSTTPTLFIYGDEDAFVPFSMLDDVYNAASCKPKAKFVIKGAAHGFAASVDHGGYWNTVWSFVDPLME